MSLLLLADQTADDLFLKRRIKELAAAYDSHAARQTTASERARLRVLRELGHLPISNAVRADASKLVRRVLAQDASFRVRAAAGHAAARVGDPRALRAMYRSLFGSDGRSNRFALLYTVLPDALAGLKHPDGVEWVGAQILGPAAKGRKSAVLTEAGPLRDDLLMLTLEGVGRAGLRLLAPEVTALARYSQLRVRAAAIRALADLDTGGAVVLAAARDKSARVRAAAVAFRQLPESRVRAALVDESATVRRSMIEALTRWPAPRAIPLLIGGLASETNDLVRLRSQEALNRLSGKDFGWDATLWRTWWAANAVKFAGPGARDKSGERYFFRIPMRTRRAVFVLDVSNSMSRRGNDQRTRQQIAGEELRRTLATLPTGARFSLIAFSGSLRRWPETENARALTRQTREAYDWFMKIRPAGATNTFAALMRALRDRIDPDTIVLLSDGNPYKCTWEGENFSEHEQILWRVRQTNRDRGARIHTVALLAGARRADKEEDAQAAAEFLRRLAHENGGEFREVR